MAILPEAAAGGEIALIKGGDLIEINTRRTINLIVTEEELSARRRAEEKGKEPGNPASSRKVSQVQSLRLHVSQADKRGETGVRWREGDEETGNC